MQQLQSPMHAPLPSLSESPDWGYLLREFHEIYRNSGAGGSERIRAHQRHVREAINRTVKADPQVLPRDASEKPVTAHFRRALDRGRIERTEAFIRAIARVSDSLAWLYGYDKVPRGLAQRYAFAELAGPQGPIETRQIILGLVLFAPGCTYPAHAHDGLSESYYVLSGTCSENDTGVYAAGSMIFNPPGHTHRITVGAREPCLLAYAWIGPEDKLAGQKMTLSRSPRSTAKP
ncbi:MAG: dimethylsulfonioproprionate lyase family protein [Pseudomonadota bacterium]